MAEIRRLAPHDEVPEKGRYLLVMRRFGEDDPGLTLVELIRSDGREAPQIEVPIDGEGRPMEFEPAIAEAARVAEAERYEVVYAVDRTAGPREREVLAHHGDRTPGMDQLEDMDLEIGERGPDMRKPMAGP